MQFPESWLREFCNPPINTAELANLLTMAGMEVEEMCPAAPPFTKIVLGEVLYMHARDGLIHPITKRVSEDAYRPVGRLFGTRYCTTRQRFELPGELPKE